MIMKCRSIVLRVVCCFFLAGGLCVHAAQLGPKPGPPTDAKKSDARKDEKTEPEKPKTRYFAVTGAVVHTITGPTLHGPTVLCKNDKIVALGYDVAIPKEAEVLDAEGFHLYPGLVAVSSYALVGVEPPDNGTDLYGLSMTLGLAGGVTTVVTGNTAAKLTFGTLEGHIVKRNLLHTLDYSPRNPEGRRKFRQSIERARQYLRDLDAHEQQKEVDPNAVPPESLKGDAETALKLLRHELVAVADADTARELVDLAVLAERYNFRLVVRGAREGWVVAPAMARAGIRAVITPRVRHDRDERTNHPNGSSIENAKILHEHGVPCAIIPARTGTSTGGIAGRDLMHIPMEAAFAVRGGLPEDVAVRAITIDAARILGIDHRVGSVEVGKDADFAIVDGDLLHYMTLVRWAVVNGRIAYDKEKDSLLNHIRPGGNLDALPPPYHWPRCLGEDW